MKIFIGCSGWNYRDWKGKFYPEDIPQKKWLEHYTTIFNTVEVNSTFYRMPRESTVAGWKDKAPPEFNFTLKGSRYVTQMKKLHDVEESVRNFEDVAAVLKTKLSCILWQLPPSLHRDDERLANFCKILNGSNKNVIEFRHESWFNKEVYQILEDHNISFCSISSPRFEEEMIVTGKVGYVRFHGKGKKWYDYKYSKDELKEWSEKIKDADADEIYIYFNNDIGGNAPEDALQLKEFLM